MRLCVLIFGEFLSRFRNIVWNELKKKKKQKQIP